MHCMRQKTPHLFDFTDGELSVAAHLRVQAALVSERRALGVERDQGKVKTGEQSQCDQ